MTSSSSTPNQIDVVVGANARRARLAAGVTLEQCADALDGMTSERLQRCEAGSSRLRASEIFLLAGLLGVTVSSFYEGLKPGKPSRSE